jgi:hypothetical protein
MSQRGRTVGGKPGPSGLSSEYVPIERIPLHPPVARSAQSEATEAAQGGKIEVVISTPARIAMS